ncbi:MAG: ABC transporter substrate-binding protein, partial [Acidobacteriota bacterium]|nr:ABC transporter substrate-binding protein [Acidobacteriota bacterium]
MRRGFFAVLLSLFVCSPLLAARRRVVGYANTIVVGGLFSLTGDGETLGRASQAALELAARDLNEELSALGTGEQVKVVLADTKLTPEGALAGIQQLAAAGASIVIGPQSSAEAAAIRQFANEHGIILISQASTASSLAIAGDNLFRLAPNDRLEGAALAALMRADGIDVVVPMWRDDAGNGGLRNSTSTLFAASGGIATSGVSYAPATTDFTATANALGNAVRAAKSANPSKKIAVFIAAFEEGAAILDRARLDPDLTVNWYSGDGLTQSRALLESGAIASFAVKTKFTAPAVALSEDTRNRWAPLSAAIEARVGFPPDAFSLSVYDAAMVAVLSSIEAGRP